MEELKREYNWFWLCSMTQLTWKEKKALLDCFGDVDLIPETGGGKWRKFTFLKEEKVQKIERHQKFFDREKEYHKWQERGIRFISCQHPDYPKSLRGIYDSPFGIFYRGSLPRDGERCVAIVGARMCTPYGRNLAREMAGKLARAGASVVSGMAYGIDASAQEAALEAGGKSYGILGCGPDICYPAQNRSLYLGLSRRGGVLSEYPPGTQVQSWHFPARNRIISGLCEQVIVVEARKKSGTLITADHALEQGRDVSAFPGRVQDVLSAGCNRLIAQGAAIITDVDEFLEESGFTVERGGKAKKSNLGLAPPEKLVYSCLDSEAQSLQAIQERSGLGAAAVMSALTALQMKGLAEEIGKNFYAARK